MLVHLKILFLLSLIILSPANACWRSLFFGSSPPPAVTNTNPQTVLGTLAEDAARIREIRNLPRESQPAATHAYSAPGPKTWFDRSFVIFDWALATYLGVHVIQGFTEQPKSFLYWIAAIPPVMYVADLVSSFFHKFV